MTKVKAKSAGKANPEPVPQNPVPKNTRRGQTKNPNVEEQVTNQPEDQPMATADVDLEQPCRGRGRPKKNVIIGGHADDAEQPPPVQAASRKRGQKPATPTEDANVQPLPKRAKVNNAHDNDPPRQRAKANSSNKPTARDPLPDRQGRNVHPAGEKPKRRSSQEVAAEKEAKAKALEERAQKIEAAKKLLAEANAYKDIQDDEMGDIIPQCLSTAVRKRQYAEIDDDSGAGEVFDFQEVDMMESSESEQPVKEKAVSRINPE